MGIDQQSPELGFAFTCVEITEGGVALAVGGNGSGVIEAFGTGPVAVAVGHLHGGRQWVHRGASGERHPAAAAIGIEHRSIEGAFLKEPAIRWIAGVADDPITEEAVEVAAAAIAAGVDVQGFAGASLHGNGLMAKASKAGVFGAGVARVGRIDLHHPAVFVAS